MCQRRTAHFESWDEVVTFDLVSRVMCGPCVARVRIFLNMLLVWSGRFRPAPDPLQFALFQPLYVVAQLQSRPQFQTHVLHDHVTPEKQQRFSIDLLQKQDTQSLGHERCVFKYQ